MIYPEISLVQHKYKKYDLHSSRNTKNPHFKFRVFKKYQKNCTEFAEMDKNRRSIASTNTIHQLHTIKPAFSFAIFSAFLCYQTGNETMGIEEAYLNVRIGFADTTETNDLNSRDERRDSKICRKEIQVLVVSVVLKWEKR